MGISFRAIGKKSQAQFVWQQAADQDPRVGDWLKAMVLDPKVNDAQ